MGALFSIPVREYMSKSLVSVPPSATHDLALQTLKERDISCVAVTGAGGELCGIVSMTDLLRHARLEMGAPGEPMVVTAPAREVRDLMRTEVITIEEAAPVRDAAALMVQHHIHRVVVMRGGKPAGVLSTRDMMRAVLFHHIELPLSEVMTTPVESIGVGDPIEQAIARLGDGNFRGLVVTDGDFPVGVFTQTEAIGARTLPRELRSTAVEQVMSYEIITLDVHTPLYRVAGQAIATRARRIIAVELGKLRGILTGFDLARVATMDVG